MKKGLLILLCLPMIGVGQQTYVPDDNFEAYLEANGMGNGIANDDYVITSKIDTVSYLDIQTQNISDLTGIEDFTGLTGWSCSYNNLSLLNLSQNINLTRLYCCLNPLASLDLSSNILLESLECGLDLDYNNNTGIPITYTLLSNLNITQNTFLKYLDIGPNQLTTLDLSQNIVLKHFSIDSSLIDSLDLTNNIALEGIGIGHSSSIYFLDIRNGTNLVIEFLGVRNNINLTCINVDDSLYSTINWVGQDFLFDSWNYFSNNCSGITTSIQEHTTNKDLLKVTDLLGRETKQTNQLLFYIYDDGTVEKKLIIE